MTETAQENAGTGRWILAIDPGSDKVGFAVVNFDLSHGELGVVYVTEIHRVFKRLCDVEKEKRPEAVVIGDGTACAVICKLFNSLEYDIPVRVSGEKNTTYRARGRYFAENPPTGIWKYVPLGLQTPPRPIDDYAAWLIGENFIREYLAIEK